VCRFGAIHGVLTHKETDGMYHRRRRSSTKLIIRIFRHVFVSVDDGMPNVDTLTEQG